MEPAEQASDGAGSTSPEPEVERLRQELELCRRELAQARAEQERIAERQSKLRRARGLAQKEAEVLGRVLAELLHRQTRETARRGWRPGRDRVSREEWDQVLTLRESDLFRPGWYLRRNLDVARKGIDPALHFLREGHREGRDPGPAFDVKDYVEAHPELHETGENPLLHHLRSQPGEDVSGPRKTG